jgi:hypothetical protein
MVFACNCTFKNEIERARKVRPLPQTIGNFAHLQELPSGGDQELTSFETRFPGLAQAPGITGICKV